MRLADDDATAGATLGALEPRSKVWIERGGHVALSEWRVELLEAVDETGSLARAAARLDVSYRTAWARLREMEAHLSLQLLTSHSGGADGGRSALTADARDVIARFKRVTAGIAETVDARVRAEFGELSR